MKHQFILARSIFMILVVLLIANCTSTKKVAETQNDANKAVVDMKKTVVSYEKDISPIMVRSCAPCHYPAEGKKKFLDTYATTAENVQDILYRVSVAPNHPDYMPFKSKKDPFSPAEVKLLKEWIAQNMPQ